MVASFPRFAFVVFASAAFASKEPPEAARCLTTVGVVKHEFRAEIPVAAREIDCLLDQGEICYVFVPSKLPDLVEYGCAKKPRGAGETPQCFWGDHRDEAGNFCLCKTSMCNLPKNFAELLTTTTTTAISTDVTTTQRIRVTPKRESLVVTESPEEYLQWEAPFALFVFFAIVMFMVFGLFVWHICQEVNSFHADSEDLNKRIAAKLKKSDEDLINWTTERATRAAEIAIKGKYSGKKESKKGDRRAPVKEPESFTMMSSSAA
ncbi:hypothetical protein L596_015652 [Steinernema carpocapsae]|uniref:Uncharacterized protein n=1 Tax=Steinernema carpocapsae TaxID=34508 RepID=A0A4U5NG93_STECR|nr:hypothetical protein L596_015652 [Steinernema carpocapsae]